MLACCTTCSGKRTGLGSLDGLGDICTDSMCSDGQANVEAMWSMFFQLSADQAGAYQAACQSIQDKMDATVGMLTAYIPFNPACCTARDIGLQAQALTAQMAQTAGVTPPPSSPSGSSSDNLIQLAYVAAIAAALYFGKGILRG